MDIQKKALWLVKFELKHSAKNLLLLIPILLLFIVLIRSLVPDYLEQATIGLDILIVFSTLFLSQFTRPKDFQMQKLRGVFYASPFIIALDQLGVSKELIVKYRFLSYFIIYSVFVILLFVGLYPSFQEVAPLSSYIVFAFSWYCLGIYLGCITPAFEAASNIAIHIVVSLLVAPILFFIYIFVFYKWYLDGFVGWMLHVAVEYPLSTIVISLLLAILGWIFWENRMKRKMRKADYL